MIFLKVPEATDITNCLTLPQDNLKLMYKQISSSMEVTDNVKCIVMFKGDLGAFLVAQSVKNLPAVQETQVRPLG